MSKSEGEAPEHRSQQAKSYISSGFVRPQPDALCHRETAIAQPRPVGSNRAQIRGLPRFAREDFGV